MITGRRCALRPVEERDFIDIHRWRNDPAVWWWADLEAPSSIDDVAADENRARREGANAFVIMADDRAVGRIALESFERRDRCCALSLLIPDGPVWENGVVADAVRTLVGYAFDRLDLHQVESRCIAEDERAIDAMASCGFVREATLRDRAFKDGAWHDHVVMSVQRKEFADVQERDGVRDPDDA